VTFVIGTGSILVRREHRGRQGSSVYWTNGADLYSGGAVMKTPIGGGTATKLALAQDSPGRIAVDDTSVYWAREPRW